MLNVVRGGAAAVMCAAVAIGASVADARQQPTFRAESTLVTVFASVREDGRPVTGLEKDDFELIVDGRRTEIAAFSNSRQPITLAMVLDRSGSVARRSGEITEAARAFFEALQPGDRASLGSLSWNCVPLTDDHERLVRAVSGPMPLDMGSPVWESIDRAFFSMSAEPGRRAILILSDGDDSGPMNFLPHTPPGDASGCRGAQGASGSSRDEVAARARRNGVIVYAVGIEQRNSSGTRDLRTLARETGGDLFVLRPGESLTTVFGRIVEDLQHHYLLGFVPPAADGRTRSIDVRTRRRGLDIRARRSYVVDAPNARADAAPAPVAPLTEAEVGMAVQDGTAGKTLKASCLTPVTSAGAYFEVSVEGPRGRIMRAAREARRGGEPFSAADVSDRLRAPTVSVVVEGRIVHQADPPAAGTSSIEAPLRTTPAPAVAPTASAVRVRSVGERPRVILPRVRTIRLRPGPHESEFDQAEFVALGAPLEAMVDGSIGTQRCRLDRGDLQRVR